MKYPLEIPLVDLNVKHNNSDGLYDYMKREIERLNNIINKTIHKIQLIQMDGEVSIKDLGTLVNILVGVDKE